MAEPNEDTLMKAAITDGPCPRGHDLQANPTGLNDFLRYPDQ